MPQFSYKARDKNGVMRTGSRFASTLDQLNNDLINEGIFPLEIKLFKEKSAFAENFENWMQGEALHKQELAIFSRQMKLLYQAGVPMVTAFKQLSAHTRSKRLAKALLGVIQYLEKGQSLASSLEHYPKVFSPLIINIVRIGENTGHLDKAFEHIHEYLEFDANNLKQVKSAFRYPIFVLISIILAIIVLNIFVIPSFGRFYVNLTVPLPWQTRLLIGSSNVMMHYGIYFLMAFGIIGFYLMRYIRSPIGKAKFDKLLLSLPVFGSLLRRIILIRFAQSLAIMHSSGLSITQSLTLVREIIDNTYIQNQIADAQEAIERGSSFVSSINKIPLFTQLEIQILAVGEKNGELTPALKYIATFHSEEIVFELKRISDLIGPILIAVVSGLILIIALGVYLPIWNMINLVHT